jgi:hypothetical protein
MAKRRKAILVLLLILTAACLYVSARQYAGFRELNRYKELRASVQSIESGFSALESTLSQAIRLYRNPAFHRELGLLYLDRAIAEDKFGDPARRDEFLDQAALAFAENIRRNRSDSWAYFELGKIYMLYNSPLLTYADRGRQYFRLALELNPAHEFLNLETLFFHLSQWDMLEAPERDYAWARLERKWLEKPAFLGQFRRQWIRAAKSDQGLKEILMSNSMLWTRISQDFK